jgi:DNA-binding XRE family transcriptional regulator
MKGQKNFFEMLRARVDKRGLGVCAEEAGVPKDTIRKIAGGRMPNLKTGIALACWLKLDLRKVAFE